MRPIPHFSRPALSHIADLPKWNVSLFIGDSRALASPRLLAEHGITTAVNCAVNLDVNLVRHDPDGPSDAELAYGAGEVRYYKIGLIDDEGNAPDQMIGAYFILRAALEQVMPERASYPHQTRGNILVNCRGGRSRSVTLVALFLHLEMPQLYPTIDHAIDHIRDKRLLMPQEWHETPKPSLLALAERARNKIMLMRESS